MAFDVYVGTMTRFYRREWENAGQRLARELGSTYHVMYAGGEPEPSPPAQDIRQAVQGWCAMLKAALAPYDAPPIEWDESDAQPYFTSRPGLDGFIAMRLWAAYAEQPDLVRPFDVPKSWINDSAYQRSTAPGFNTRYDAILLPHLWIPIDLPFTFKASALVSDHRTPVGSVFGLNRQIDVLREATASILTESAPEETEFARTARYGIEIFTDLADKACHHRLPMLLDY
jgi:hypothetical protein